MFSDDYGLDMDGLDEMEEGGYGPSSGSPHDRGKLSANLK